VVAERRRAGGPAASATVLVFELDTEVLAELLLVVLVHHVVPGEVEKFVGLRVHRADAALQRARVEVAAFREAFADLVGGRTGVRDQQDVVDANAVLIEEFFHPVEEFGRLPASGTPEETGHSFRRIGTHYTNAMAPGLIKGRESYRHWKLPDRRLRDRPYPWRRRPYEASGGVSWRPGFSHFTSVSDLVLTFRTHSWVLYLARGEHPRVRVGHE